jgi:hypothetical protein
MNVFRLCRGQKYGGHAAASPDPDDDSAPTVRFLDGLAIASPN